ncbi:acyltransferase family protein [Prosthecomicrobium hirschii]|uniref:acyltransferase family protein n=1 Tax=Prosthecodimorpha hirschii TaxID=665126 RepID=UPI000A649361|nr:acyltransferase [Prosthecomicrobium hirschii]
MILKTVQAGRAIAAISVVIFHTEVVLRLEKYLGIAVFPFAEAMHFGVNFFFVLSGFIIATTHWGDLGKPRAIGKFLLRRFSRIFPPLWIALALSASLSVALGKSHPTFVEWILAITAFPIHVEEPLLAVEWTLRHEVLFYILYAVAIWRPLFGAIGMLIWVIVPFVFIFPDQKNTISVVISPYNALFLFGVLAAFRCRYKAMGRIGAIMTFVAGVALFVFAWFGELFLFGGTYALGTLLYGIASTLILVGMVQAERLAIMNAHHVLTWLGDASYSIYLVHFLAVSAAAKIFSPLAINKVVSVEIVFALVVIVSVAFGIVFYIIFEKYLIRWMKNQIYP